MECAVVPMPFTVAACGSCSIFVRTPAHGPSDLPPWQIAQTMSGHSQLTSPVRNSLLVKSNPSAALSDGSASDWSYHSLQRTEWHPLPHR